MTAKPTGRWFWRASRRGTALAKRGMTRLAIFLVDAAFLAYLFMMTSYVVSRIASGAGAYLPVRGEYVILGAIGAAIAWGVFGTSVGEKLILFLSGASQKKAAISPTGVALQHQRWYKTLWGLSVVTAAIVTLAAATLITQVDFSRLANSLPDTWKMLRRLVRPDAAIFGEVVLLTIVTVFMALIATLLAIPVAVVLSFFAARNLTHGPVGRTAYVVVRAAASIVRSVEPMIWAIVFVIWVRMGPFAGTLALFVCSIADLTKLYSEQLESIDPGPAEAITAVGGRRLQVLLYSIVPQIINPYLSFTLYRWDINVRMGTVIGMVGGGGIGMLLMQYVRVLAWEQVGMCLLAIIVVVWSIDALSARLRARLS
ncbi:MAG: phosphonate ABC transporter, permease protein PhnE [Candidatus Bipolaricaulota bacterium]|nr:phosphonate ABC transporter, permease protein PhnE [Candidatus Bipolaricaulota bacterium]